MKRRAPRSKRTCPLFPYSTLHRSAAWHKMSPQISKGDNHDEAIRENGHASGSRSSGADGRFDTGPGAGCGQRAGHPDGRRHLPDRLSPARRSEEHTSELQSLMSISYAVFCLKKKKTKKVKTYSNTREKTYRTIK